MTPTRESIEAQFAPTPVMFIPCGWKKLSTSDEVYHSKLEFVLPTAPLRRETVVVVLCAQTGLDTQEKFCIWGHHRIVPLLLRCKDFPRPVIPVIRRADCNPATASASAASASVAHRPYLHPASEEQPASTAVNLDDLQKEVEFRLEQYHNPTEACMTLSSVSYTIACAAVRYSPIKTRDALIRKFIHGEQAIAKYQLGQATMNTAPFKIDVCGPGGTELLFFCQIRTKHAVLEGGFVKCISPALKCWHELELSRLEHEKRVCETDYPRIMNSGHDGLLQMLRDFQFRLRYGQMDANTGFKARNGAPVAPVTDIEELHTVMPACMVPLARMAFKPKRSISTLNQKEERLHYNDRLLFSSYVLSSGVSLESYTNAYVSASHIDSQKVSNHVSQFKREHTALVKKGWPDFTSCNKMMEQGRCPYAAQQPGQDGARQAKISCHREQNRLAGRTTDPDPQWFYSPISFTQKLKAALVQQQRQKHESAVSAAASPSPTVPMAIDNGEDEADEEAEKGGVVRSYNPPRARSRVISGIKRKLNVS